MAKADFGLTLLCGATDGMDDTDDEGAPVSDPARFTPVNGLWQNDGGQNNADKLLIILPSMILPGLGGRGRSVWA